MLGHVIPILGLALLSGSWALIQRLCDRGASRGGSRCGSCGQGCVRGEGIMPDRAFDPVRRKSPGKHIDPKRQRTTGGVG